MKIQKLALLSILLITMSVNAQNITKIELKNVADRVSEGGQYPISTTKGSPRITTTENASITNRVVGCEVGASVSNNGYRNALLIYNNFTIMHDDPDIYLKFDGSSISTSTGMTSSSFVASIDHLWRIITATSEKDIVTSDVKWSFEDTKTKDIGKKGDMVCFNTKYSTKYDVVYGFWGNLKTKELFFVKWSMSTDKLTTLKIADSFGGKVVSKGGMCIYNKTDTHGNVVSAHIYSIYIKGMEVEFDAKLPIKKDLEIQDFTYNSTDGYTAVFLSENSIGNGVISIVNISEDDTSCVIRSFDELKPYLWTGGYGVGNPTHSEGGVFLSPNSGPMMEHNILITQEPTTDGDYLILLRPKPGITTYPCSDQKAQIFSQVPTIVGIDKRTLKTLGWDVVNTYKQNYFGGEYLNNYSFTNFSSSWSEKLQKVNFTQLPKENTSARNTLFCSASRYIGVDTRKPTRSTNSAKSPKVPRKVTVVKVDTAAEGYVYDKVGSESLKYNLRPVHKKDKYGYIDKNDTEIVPVKYTSVGVISDGMIKVYNGNSYGFYNIEGKLVIPLVLIEASDFKNGNAIVIAKVKGKCKAYKDGRVEKINTTSSSDLAENDFDTEYNLKHVQKEGKHGYVDEDNNEIVPIRFASVGKIIEGMIKVEYRGKFGFYNVEGKRVISFIGLRS